MKKPAAPPALERDRLRDVIEAMLLLEGAADPWLHWDELRYKVPPDGLTHEAWWWGLKLKRRASLRDLPLRDPRGAPFRVALPDEAFDLLRVVNQTSAGRLAVDDQVLNDDNRRRFLISSLQEEAIFSSLLEGAGTTRSAAKDMLRTGRAPANEGERMVLANYRAMEAVSSWRSEAITPERIRELHAIVTERTLPDADRGRLRDDADDVVVVEHGYGEVLHRPPPAVELRDRLAALCAFAEGEGSGVLGDPVVRSVLLHFWLAYDHPFVDGNGRTARALFYWSMLRRGYWLTEFVPLSRVLREARVQYLRSFLYVETDEGDTSYFVLHQLRVLVRAIRDVEAWLSRKHREVRDAERLLQPGRYNHRQLALVQHALRHADAVYTFQSHQGSHGISYPTAREDLLRLEADGLLRSFKRGKQVVFEATEALREGTRPSVKTDGTGAARG